MVLQKHVRHVVHDPVIPILPTQPHVAFDRQHLKPLFAELHERHVEGAAAQVVHQDRAWAVLGQFRTRRHLERVRERGCRRFVDNVQHVQPGDATGVLRGFAAGVVEVRGDGDDRLFDRPEDVFGVQYEFSQDDRGQRFRAERFPRHRAAVIGQPHPSLYHRRHTFGLFECQVESRLTDHGMAVVREVNRAGRQDVAVPVRDRDRSPPVIQVRNRTVRRTQINADDGHGDSSTTGETGCWGIVDCCGRNSRSTRQKPTNYHSWAWRVHRFRIVTCPSSE